MIFCCVKFRKHNDKKKMEVDADAEARENHGIDGPRDPEPVLSSGFNLNEDCRRFRVWALGLVRRGPCTLCGGSPLPHHT